MSKVARRGSSREGSVLGCVFETAIGPCGMTWTPDNKVNGFYLPEPTQSKLTKKLERVGVLIKKAEQVPSVILKLIGKIKKHLSGQPQDFSKVAVRLDASTEFQQKIYSIVKNIPSGDVVTYKELGEALGGLKAYRAIGAAMGKNPIPLLIPCHRVVGSNGKLGGFTAPGGLKTKVKLLELEKKFHSY